MSLPKLSIRGGNGLGDAIYVHSVVRHFVLKGHEVEVPTRWPDVFSQLPVKTSKFRRENITNLAHYTTRKGVKGTSQFQDVCINAGVHEPIPFELAWKPTNLELYERVRSFKKPVIAVALPRNPMGRTDGFGKEILPTRAGYQAVIDAIAGRAHIVMVGAGAAVYKLAGVDLDLTGKTTVKELFDVACAADGFVGFCSYFVPLAESQNKPALFVWSRRNLSASLHYVRQITPQKVLHRASSQWVFDDGAVEEIKRAADKFCEAMADRSSVEWSAQCPDGEQGRCATEV
jgi:hypothetical protein